VGKNERLLSGNGNVNVQKVGDGAFAQKKDAIYLGEASLSKICGGPGETPRKESRGGEQQTLK